VKRFKRILCICMEAKFENNIVESLLKNDIEHTQFYFFALDRNIPLQVQYA
jgi:hypothetical protein